MTKHTNLSEAYAAAYAEITEPPLDAVGTVAGSSKYAYTTLSGLLNHVRPILARHGLALYHQTRCDVIDSTRGTVSCEARIVHESDASKCLAASITVPVEAMVKRDGTVINPGPQAYGIAATYSRRYASYAVLSVGGETDNDGRAIHDAENPKPAPRPASPPAREPEPPHSSTPEYEESQKKKRPASEAQRKRMWAIAKKAGYTSDDLKTACRELFDVSSSDALTWGQVDTIVELCEAGKLTEDSIPFGDDAPRREETLTERLARLERENGREPGSEG